MFLNTNICCRPNFVLLFISWTNLAPYNMNWHIITKLNIFYPSEIMRTPWRSWHFLCNNFMWVVSCSLEYSHTYIGTLRKLVPNIFPKLQVRLEFEDEAWELNLCKAPIWITFCTSGQLLTVQILTFSPWSPMLRQILEIDICHFPLPS
jgi:hypothetical protein